MSYRGKAFLATEYPYIAPFLYVFDDKNLYIPVDTFIGKKM